MKRILTVFMLCNFVCCLHAKNPWAEMEESVAAREGRPAQSAPAHNSGKVAGTNPTSKPKKSKTPKPGKVSVIPQILQGKPVVVSIYPPSQYMDSERYKVAEQLVYQAYNDWFKNAVDWIEYEHREKEFSDILPVLKRGVDVRFVAFASKEKKMPEDVWVAFEDTVEDVQKDCDCSACIGCERSGGKDYTISIVVSADGYYSTLVHEIGHTLGFADAYEDGYEQNASKTHRSENRVPLTVMEAGDNELSADDADGLINIIDSWTLRAMRKKHAKTWKEHVSPRILKGWNSLLRWKTGSSVDRYKMGTSEKVLAAQQRQQQKTRPTSK